MFIAFANFAQMKLWPLVYVFLDEAQSKNIMFLSNCVCLGTLPSRLLLLLLLNYAAS